METVTLTHFQLGQLLSTAVEIGVTRATEKKIWISKMGAEKKYGRRAIDRWIRDAKIEPVYQKGRIKLSTDKLFELSKIDELYGSFISELS